MGLNNFRNEIFSRMRGQRVEETTTRKVLYLEWRVCLYYSVFGSRRK